MSDMIHSISVNHKPEVPAREVKILIRGRSVRGAEGLIGWEGSNLKCPRAGRVKWQTQAALLSAA